MKNYIIIGLIFGLMAKVQGQERWSLQTCIQTAHSNSPIVKQNRLTAQQSQYQLLQSRVAMLPSVQASIGQNFFWGRAIDPYTNQFSNQSSQSQSLNLNSSVTLYNGFVAQNIVKQNQLSAQASQLDIQQAQDQISLAVLVAYLQALSAEDALTIALKQVEVTKAQIERSEALVIAGSVAPHILLDLKSQLAGDELSAISAKNLIKSSYLALSQAMNTPYSENITLERLSAEDKFMGNYNTSKDQVASNAEKNLAVIKAADLRIDAANWASTVAKGRLQPSLNMYGNISTRNSTTAPLDFKTQLSANLFKYLGLELTVPIFNGFQNKLRLQTATIGQKMAKTQAEGLRLQLSQAIDQAHLNMQNAHDRYKGLSIQSKALEQAFESTSMRFNAGNLNVLDFTIAKTNLDRSKLNLVQAQYEYIFRTKVLDFYQGKQLE